MRYTELVINDSTTLKLRLTMESMVLIERRFGESPLVIISRIGSEGWNRSDAVSILYYALIGDYSINDVYDILDLYLEENTDEDLAMTIVQLIKDSGFFGDYKHNEKENNTESSDEVVSDNIDKQETFEESLVDFLKGCMIKGISEDVFWTSTYGELNRIVDSIIDSEKNKSKEKASFDYRLANLIGISVARIMSNEVEFPGIEEIYPEIFEAEIAAEARRKAQEAKKAAAMRARFLEYASWHNNKMKLQEIKEENKKED